MKPMHSGLIHWGSHLHPLVIVLVIVLLNVFWTTTLATFGSHFEQISGFQPIDLQNVSSILSAEDALQQISTYTAETRSLYWSFFILDNFVPLIVFGAFSLLWVMLLRWLPGTFFQNLLASPFILLPWGVGLFDIAENVLFVTAINNVSEPNVLAILNTGLMFTRLKAFCLFVSFFTTMLLVLSVFVITVRQRLGQTMTPKRAAL